MLTEVFSPKGGVGKSSISLALSYALADSGKRVLLIDKDLNSYTSKLLGLKGVGLFGLVASGANPEGAVLKKKVGNGLLIAVQLFGDLPTFMRMLPKLNHDPRIKVQVQRFIEDYLTGFDLVMVDNPPNVSSLDEFSIHVPNYIHYFSEDRLVNLYVTDYTEQGMIDLLTYALHLHGLRGGDAALAVNMVPPLPDEVYLTLERARSLRRQLNSNYLALLLFSESLYLKKEPWNADDFMTIMRNFANCIWNGGSCEVVQNL
jgi:hypothetical protein